MIQLSSTGELLASLAAAHDIDVQAYTLHGPVLRALEAAGKRGEHVVVHLEATPFADPKGDLARENKKLADQMRASGIDARLEHPLHAKAITADGTLYLDDKNWRVGDLVLRDDDPADAATIPMKKADALAQEAQLLQSARTGDGVIVESESFGGYNVVWTALKKLGQAGMAPRLLVSSRDLSGNAKERAMLETIAAAGVQVRVCGDSEKFALVGDRAWMGSANATAAWGNGAMPDWGVRSDDPTIVNAIRARLEALWAKGHELKPIRS